MIHLPLCALSAFNNHVGVPVQVKYVGNTDFAELLKILVMAFDTTTMVQNPHNNV